MSLSGPITKNAAIVLGDFHSPGEGWRLVITSCRARDLSFDGAATEELISILQKDLNVQDNSILY